MMLSLQPRRFGYRHCWQKGLSWFCSFLVLLGGVAWPRPALAASQIYQDPFNSVPTWSSTNDTGTPSTWQRGTGGATGRFSYFLQSYQAAPNNSTRAQVITVPVNSFIKISIYMRAADYASDWSMLFAYRPGAYTAADFERSQSGWTIVNEFSNTGTNGNSNIWTQYTNTFTNTSDTQLTVVYRLVTTDSTSVSVGFDDLVIEALNDPPTITAVSDQSTNEDTVTGAIAFTVGDAETAAESLTVSGSSSNTALVPDANIVFGGSGAGRTVTVTPAANQNGTATITLTVSDGTLSTSTTFTLTVAAVNDTPVLAANTGLTVDEGGSGIVTAAKLQVTDVDNTAAQLTFTVGTAPADGTLYRSGVALAAGGTFTQADVDAGSISYTHNGGEITSDSFAFTVADGAGGSIASTAFAITVTPVNDAPVAAVNQTLTLNEGASAPISNALLQATDVDNTPAQLTFTVGTATVNGTVYKSGVALGAGSTFTQADIDAGSISYTHNGNEITSDTCAFTVSDGAGGSTATFNFWITVNPVNDAPIMGTNAGLTLKEGASSTISNTLLRVTDVDNTAAQITFTVGTATVNGTLYKSGTALSGGSTFTQDDIDNNRITYTHNGGGTASDSFTFTVSDGAGGSIAGTTFNITVNNAPIAAFHTALEFNGSNNYVRMPDSAATRLSNNFTIEFWIKAASTSQPAAYVVTRDSGVGMQTSILFNNPAGTVSFYAHTYSGSDPRPGSNLPITDTEWHHVAYAYNGTTWSGYLDGAQVFSTPRTFSLHTGSYDWWIGTSSLGSPFIGQMDELRIWNVARSATDIQANYRRSLVSNETGLVAYYRFDEETGNSLIDYSATGQDGTLSATPPAWVPSTAGFTYTTAEDADVTITLAGYDPDGDSMSARIRTLPSYGTLYQYNNGTRGAAITSAGAVTDPSWRVIFAPAANGSGSPYDQFGFVVNDDVVDSSEATVTLNVTAVNDAPVLAANAGLTVDEGSSGTITAAKLQVTDVDNTAAQITYTIGTAPANGTLYRSGVALAAAGTFTQADMDAGIITYTHSGGETTSDSFTFTVSDGAGGTISATTFSITVNAVNDAPTITSVSDQSINEDGVTSALSFTVGDAETAAASLTVSGSSSNTALVPDANIVFGGSGASLTVTMTPAANTSGTATITLTVSDGTTSTSTSFTLTVSAVNDTPTLAANTGLTVDEGSSGTITAAKLQVTDADNTAAQITYTIETAPANGTLYRSGVALAAAGTFTQADVDAGIITYTHSGGETTSDSFTFTVSDGAGGTISATTFSITVNAVNDAPAITMPGAQGTDEDTNLAISGISVSDADAGSADIQATFTVGNGTLTVNTGVSGGVGAVGVTGNGTVTVTVTGTVNQVNNTLADTNGLVYRGTLNFNSTDRLTVTANDQGNTGSGGAKTDTRSVDITVNPVNDPPGLGTIADQSNAEGSGVELTVTGADADGDTLTYSATGLPPGLSIGASTGVISGTLTYTAAGTHNVTVTVTDNTPGDATNSASRTFTWTVADGNRPPTPTTGAQTIDEGGTLAALAATDPDGDPLTFALAGGALPPGIALNAGGTFAGTAAPGSAGSYTAQITVSDGRGGSATAALHVTVNDRTPPEVALGSLQDGKLYNAVPILAGTAETGATVRVYVDGALAATLQADAAGQWSYTPAVADGRHTVRAAATDAAGNEGATGTVGFALDTAKPAVTMSSPTASSNGASLSGTAEPSAMVRVYIDGGLTAVGRPDAAGNWVFNSGALASGSHTVRVTATDAAGNEGAAQTVTFTVGTAVTPEADDGVNAGENATPGTTPAPGGSAITAAGGATVTPVTAPTPPEARVTAAPVTVSGTGTATVTFNLPAGGQGTNGNPLAPGQDNVLLFHYYDEHLKAWIAVPTSVSTGQVSASVPAGVPVTLMQSDVKQAPDTADHWANASVLKLKSLGLMAGFPDGTFRPDEPVNRYQAAVLLALVVKLDLTQVDAATVSDLRDNAEFPDWARPYVAATVSADLMRGFKDHGGKWFRGDVAMTRAQMATILGRILGTSAEASLEFSDAEAIPAWAREGVARAVAAGVLSGLPDGSFRPDEPLTRGQLAKLLAVVVDRLVK